MNYFRIIVITIIVTIVTGFTSGCYLFPQEEEVMAPPLVEPAEVAYSVMEVVERDIERKVTGSASFVSMEQSNFFFKERGGRLKGVYVKVGEDVKKGDLLLELNTDGLENEIEQQRILLKKAQVAYNQVKSREGDEYALQQASLDIDLVRLRLRHLEKELEESKLYATIDGRVVYVNYNVNEGDYVNAFQTLVRIADPERIQLQYSGNQVREFKLGHRVEVKLQNKIYEGEVVMTPANVPTDADESLREIILIDVLDKPEDVSLGDNAAITLVLERNENTIVVPKQAVRNYMGRRYVHVLEDGLRKERDVALGIETPTEYEILEGLEVGEMLVLR